MSTASRLFFRLGGATRYRFLLWPILAMGISVKFEQQFQGNGMKHKVRVLVAKPGLDGHDRGAKIIASALRDAGFEVIYSGLHQTPEMIVESALQEDVDVIGVSLLSGAHMTLFPKIKKLMEEKGLDDVLLTGGGIIPPDDVETLEKMGTGRLFGPGSNTTEIIEYISDWATQNR